MREGDEDDFLFQDESVEEASSDSDKGKETAEKKRWKIIIADDEESVHKLTRMSFHHFEFEDKKLEFLSTFSGEETKKVLMENPDTALLLLDVVMEKDTSGLEVVKFLRENLKNKVTRIIIRTGQPGQAPEKKVIIDYDINDYKEKTELTQEKFYTAIVVALRSYRDLNELKKSKEKVLNLVEAMDRFVPHEFLKFLNKDSVNEVSLGDYLELEMTVLFLDIRSFTKTVEKLTPHEAFDFVNSLLSFVEPPIIRAQGFIDKYIGDSIMALFYGPHQAQNAINAAIDMLNSLKDFNKEQLKHSKDYVDIGISIDSGKVVLGAIGFYDRMDCTVISDVVNTAAKLEKMNKMFGTKLLTTETTFKKLTTDRGLNWRSFGKVHLVGKDIEQSIVEIFSWDSDTNKDLKEETKYLFEKGIVLYGEKKFPEAAKCFKEVLKINPIDKVADYFLQNSTGIVLNRRREDKI